MRAHAHLPRSAGITQEKQAEAMIKKRGNKWVVLSKSGRTLGTHASRAQAVNQLQAVEASKARRKKAGKRKKKK